MKLKTIIEICAEPIIVYDKQGLTTYVNPSFERVFGWRGREIIGSPIDFVPEDQIELTEKSVAKVIAGQTISGMETQRKTKNGETIHVRLSAAPFKDGEGNFDGMVVTLQDISDLVRSRWQALAADQAKSEFLSNVSHEVRTPMNHVMGMIELLLNTRLDAKQQEFMEILQTSADSLMMTINDMLDYSKIESGEVGCDAIGFDLRTLVEKVAHLMAPKAAEKGLAFDLFVHQFVPSLLMGDPRRLRQVLVNLCSNAIKFTKHGGVKINIFLEKENDTAAKIRFEVSDTGIGIAPDQTQMIFDSFAQVNGYLPKPIKPQELYDCISTAFMAGRLGQDEMITRHSLTENRKQQVKILLVEAGRVNRKIILNILGKSGYSANSKIDMDGVFETFKTEKFNLILLDIDLPGSLGLLNTIRQYETQEKKKRVPVIAMTDVQMGDEIQKGFQGYVEDCLLKPVTPEKLLASIETWTWQDEAFLRAHVGVVTTIKWSEV